MDLKPRIKTLNKTQQKPTKFLGWFYIFCLFEFNECLYKIFVQIFLIHTILYNYYKKSLINY